MSDAETIMDIARIISGMAMLATMAVLLARFIGNCIRASSGTGAVNGHFILSCTYTSERIVNPNIHDRKFALFPCGAGHGCFT
jgi:hypothetical protein